MTAKSPAKPKTAKKAAEKKKPRPKPTPPPPPKTIENRKPPLTKRVLRGLVAAFERLEILERDNGSLLFPIGTPRGVKGTKWVKKAREWLNATVEHKAKIAQTGETAS